MALSAREDGLSELRIDDYANMKLDFGRDDMSAKDKDAMAQLRGLQRSGVDVVEWLKETLQRAEANIPEKADQAGQEWYSTNLERWKAGIRR